MTKKPDQVIDEITNVIYPPAEAIPGQLDAIKTMANSTKKIYESTKDIHSIFPNLDAIQGVLDYLRGLPMMDELKPEEPLPEDTLKPVYIPASTGFNITSSLNAKGEYDVSIVGIDVEPKLTHPELFGDIGVAVVEMGIEIPVTCGKTYLVAQENPILVYYTTDESILEVEKGVYVKEKEYTMEEDFFQYVFLLKEGRSKVAINIYADFEDPIVFNITSHIHFKEQEPSKGEDDNENNSDNG